MEPNIDWTWVILIGVLIANVSAVTVMLVLMLKKLMAQMDYTNRLILSERLFANNPAGLQAIARMPGIGMPIQVKPSASVLKDENMKPKPGVVFTQKAG